KNLLSNAFKFTDRGEVRLRIDVAKQGWSINQETLCSPSGFEPGFQRLTMIRHSVEIVFSSVGVHHQIVCSDPR
ncbi:MAG TPA: hypothetical protein VKO67_08425, partial [Smithellaceae bacterium]|nr:hypothetical protein [Smithellaceae bacterium]